MSDKKIVEVFITTTNSVEIIKAASASVIVAIPERPTTQISSTDQEQAASASAITPVPSRPASQPQVQADSGSRSDNKT